MASSSRTKSQVPGSPIGGMKERKVLLFCKALDSWVCVPLAISTENSQQVPTAERTPKPKPQPMPLSVRS